MPYDTQEQINTCLSCKRKTCTGDCCAVRKADTRPKKHKAGSIASRITPELFAPVLAGEMTMVQLSKVVGIKVSTLYDHRDAAVYGWGGKRI